MPAGCGRGHPDDKAGAIGASLRGATRMMQPATRARGYDAGAMILHWIIAPAVLVQLGGGILMGRPGLLPDDARFGLFQWHKTIGLLVLALTLARIAWRLANPPPPAPPMSVPERVLSGLVHAAFYVLMLVVPLTGWLLVSVSPTRIPTLLFLSEGLVWPDLPPLAGAAATAAAHEWLAYSFVALLVLHVAGALKHSLVDREPSFSRMLPAGGLERSPAARLSVPLALGVAAAFIAGGLVLGRSGGEVADLRGAGAPMADPPGARGEAGWAIDGAASRLGFEISFSGNPVAGAIGRWTADVTFDPENLPAAVARVMADTSSITVSDGFLGASVGGDDGFQAAAHPTAEVRLDRFEKAAEGFLARGTVTIRGIAAPVEVPFTFEAGEDGRARVAGRAVLDRLAFGIGAQNDAGAQWLSRTVKVTFRVEAQRTQGSPPAR